jgi:hypothetical protein
MDRIEPQLNCGSIPADWRNKPITIPHQELFVWICKIKSTRYNLSSGEAASRARRFQPAIAHVGDKSHQPAAIAHSRDKDLWSIIHQHPPFFFLSSFLNLEQGITHYTLLSNHLLSTSSLI